MDFIVIDQAFVRYSAFGRYWRKMGVQWNIASVIYRFREEKIVLYSVLIEFGIPVKVDGLIKM